MSDLALVTNECKEVAAPKADRDAQNLPIGTQSPNPNLIFVVDDDSITRTMIRDCLAQAGYDVIEAGDGQAALDLLDVHMPVLMLLDCRMPRLSGFETCRRLQTKRSAGGLPIVMFLTALTDLQDKVSGFDFGAVDYLTKPVEPHELLARIRTHVELAVARSLLSQQLLQCEVSRARQAGQLRSGQESLLTSPSTIPELRTAVSFIPAHDAGGDFYEIVRLGDDEYGFLVMDVAGHDLSVPFVTGALKALAVTFLKEAMSSTESFLMFNDSLRSLLPGDLYVTGCYARFHRDTMQLEVVNAGHPPALLRAANGRCQWLDVVGDALGMFERVTFESKVVPISPGDRLFLYTDGLVESLGGRSYGPGTTLVGKQRLQAMVQDCREPDIQGSVDRILAELGSLGCGRISDDVVVMAVEF